MNVFPDSPPPSTRKVFSRNQPCGASMQDAWAKTSLARHWYEYSISLQVTLPSLPNSRRHYSNKTNCRFYWGSGSRCVMKQKWKNSWVAPLHTYPIRHEPTHPVAQKASKGLAQLVGAQGPAEEMIGFLESTRPTARSLSRSPLQSTTERGAVCGSPSQLHQGTIQWRTPSPFVTWTPFSPSPVKYSSPNSNQKPFPRIPSLSLLSWPHPKPVLYCPLYTGELMGLFLQAWSRYVRYINGRQRQPEARHIMDVSRSLHSIAKYIYLEKLPSEHV